jgi:hypothetical protein
MYEKKSTRLEAQEVQNEREFWSTHATTDYFDLPKANRLENLILRQSSGEIYFASIGS